MFNLFFTLYEMRPSVMWKRFNQQLNARIAGEKKARDFRYKLFKLEQNRPKFTPSPEVMNVIVKNEINNILAEQYGNYLPPEMRWMKDLHKDIRDAVGDEKFLEYLKHVKERHPRPIYKSPFLKVKS